MILQSILSKIISIFSKDKKPKLENSNPKVKESIISKKACDLIIKYEVGGGESYYNSKLKRLQYVGGSSGITGGIGYDFAFYTKEEVDEAWGRHFPQSTLNRLYKLKGKNGSAALSIQSQYSDIIIPWSAAIEVFERITIPSQYSKARKLFPCFDSLHPDVQGALVSIVFNRGTSISGDSRKEMLQLTQVTCSKDYKKMAKLVRDMKRLWVGKGLDGLLRRREEEAKLIESAI